ncbi:uncharacterized protein [Paramormyrops kingsleyae]|uniref:uncharacterized protein n=1 Tax=Paramormyrops kingsleyae TaxID=1676925 RepID=UPI003B96E59B
MFHVVKFLATQSVAVVPSEWYSAGETMWPNYKSDKRIDKAIQQRERPGEDWDQHDCTVLKSCDNYLQARQAMKKSLTCSTSDMQSEQDDEEDSRPRRKPKPVHYLGDSDFDSDDTEMKAPHKKRRDYIPALRLPSTSAQAPPIPPPPNITPQVTPPVAAKAQPTYRLSLPEMNTTTLDGQHLFHPTSRVARTGTGQIPCTAAQLHMLTLLEQVKHQQNQIILMLNNLNSKVFENQECQESLEMPEGL